MSRFTGVCSIVLLFVLLAPPVQASTNCGTCAGHYTSTQSNYPFDEGITFDNITVTNSWTTVAKGCVNGPLYGVNLDSGSSVNVALRAYLKIVSATAPAGSRYEVRFARKRLGSTPGSQLSTDLIETYGWYTRNFEGRLANGTYTARFPQGEHFNSTIQNLPSGQHQIELQARMIDSGYTFTVDLELLTMQGVPSDGTTLPNSSRFPSGKSVASASTNITSTWSVISPVLTFTNTATVNLQAQAYMEINGGTAGDQITYGFQLDNEASSRRNSDVAVRPQINGYAVRQGVNIYDHIENVPPGTHTLRLWAIDRRSGGTVPVSWRQIEFVSFPASSYYSGANFAQGNGAGGFVVDSTVTPADGIQPFIGNGCGNFYKLLEFNMPQSAGEWSWTGGGYVELLGETAGTWDASRGEIAVEVYDVNDPSTVIDMHFVQFNLPQGRGHVYFDIDAFRWARNTTWKVKLWIRKVSVGACAPGGAGTFTVGKSYLGMQLIPMDNTGCFYTP